ncbi:MAG: hypothetical protein ACK55I_06955, partial [bacterium]
AGTGQQRVPLVVPVRRHLRGARGRGRRGRRPGDGLQVGGHHGGLGQERRRLPSPRVRAGAVLVVRAPARIARALEVHGTLLANHEVSRGRAVSTAVAWPR